MIDNSKEYILCAAIRRKEPHKDWCGYYENQNDIRFIEIGYRHHDIYQRFNDRDIYENLDDAPLSIKMEDQGFYTSKGRFVDRYEGMEIAYNAGQVDEYTALSKKWREIKLNDGIKTDDEYWKRVDPQKFNMLFSEDLY